LQVSEDGVLARVEEAADMNSQHDRPHEEAMAETFARDPALAADMLTAILADGDHDELLVTLRQIARAKEIAGKSR
jgi:DNA-binding phage protein